MNLYANWYILKLIFGKIKFFHDDFCRSKTPSYFKQRCIIKNKPSL